MPLQIICNIYKKELALNNIQWLIYNKTQPKQTLAFADGLSPECEWQLISSGLQDSSQYFGRYQHWCLNGLGSSSDFQLFQPPFQTFGGTVSSALITIGVTVTLMCHNFLSCLVKSKFLPVFSFSLFSLCGLLGRQNPLYGKLSFFVN